MTQIVTFIFMFLGALFALLAAVGIVRMPDLFTRMQTATKASTLGVMCLMLGAAFHFGEIGVVTRAAATVVFVLLTAPVAAHLIGRAAYFVGVPLWEHTVADELRGHYDWRTHELETERAALSDNKPPQDSI